MFKTAIKRWAVLLSALFGTSALAFAGVTISSPAPGATSASPVHFVASASSSQSISAMAVYVDNVSQFTTFSNHLDTNIAVPAGQHYVVVQAWDANGAVMKAPENILVSTSSVSASPASTSTQAAAPAGAAVHGAIQTMPNWESCTVCAGVNAQGPAAQYAMGEHVASPSLSGQAAQFQISGSTPYSDAIWWKQLGGDNSKTHFQYDLDFYLTQPQLAQSLEFDANQSNGTTKFIYCTHCNITV